MLINAHLLCLVNKHSKWLINEIIKLLSNFLLDFMLINEINNKDISKSHQVIGSNVVRILKLELIFSFTDMIVIKFSYDKIGVNLASSVRLGLITQSAIEISDT